MKEQFVSLLLVLNKISFISYLLLKTYQVIENYTSKKISKLQGVRSVYIKGSYATKSLEPGVSDIDYVVIVENESNKEGIEIFFKKMNILFPFIGDVDTYLEGELGLLLKYGSNKYRDHSKWLHKSGIDCRKDEYVYYPLKFFIEQVHELFFYLEWILINFEKFSKRQSLYRKRTIDRGILKFVNTILWIKDSTEFKMTLKPQEEVESIHKKIVEDIFQNNSLHSLSLFIAKSDVLNYYLSLLPREFAWFEKNQTEEYLDNCHVLVSIGKFKYIRGDIQKNTRKDLLVLTNEHAELLTQVGCFHFDVLFNFAKNSKQRLCGSMIKLFAYTKILEGRDSELFDGDVGNIKLLDDQITNRIKTDVLSPYDLKNKTVFITANWGSNKRRFWSLEKTAQEFKKQSVSLPWFHFDMNFDSTDFRSHPDFINHIKIYGKEENRGLWLKECLFNFGAHYCFGAKNYIFSDADVYSNDTHWLEDIEHKMNSENFDFVHGFSKVTDTVDKDYSYFSWTRNFLEENLSFEAPGLVWGIPRKTYILLEFLPDIFPDGSNDGALIQELTNIEMGVTAKYDWYSTRIRSFPKEFNITYSNIDVIHINHGVSRDYVNRGALLDLVKVPFEDMYKKDYVGLYTWNKNEDYKVAIDLSNKYFQLDSNDFILLVNELIEKNIIKIPKKMIFWSEYPHDNYLEIQNGVGFLYKTGVNKYKIVTSKYNYKSKIKLRWGGYYMMDNEHLYLKFLVKKNPVDYFDISVNYNWWRLAGSNNTYDQKFFRNLIEQPLAICASSWEDHAITFIDIETDNYTPGSSYEIAKIEEERINFYHAWDKIEELTIPFNDLSLIKNAFDIPLSEELLNKNGWFRINVKLNEIEKIPLKITVVAGTKGVPVTTTRLFDDSQADYLRIIFHKNIYMNNLRLRVKLDIRKHIKFASVNMILNERRKI